MMKMKQLLCDGIYILINLPVLAIQEFKMEIVENEHASMMGRVILDAKEDINLFAEETVVKVFEKERNVIIFQGKIVKLNISDLGYYKEAKLYAYSDTVNMDKVKRKCAWQNTELTYEEIAKSIMRTTKQLRVIWENKVGKNIQSPLIQYEETDWEFLKRLASHFNSIIYPSMEEGREGVFFGLRKGRQRDEKNIEVLQYGFSKRFYQFGLNIGRKSKDNTRYIEAESYQRYEIGDYFIINNIFYTIYRMHAVYSKGMTVYRYFLGTAGMYFQKKYNNPLLSGVHLQGVIKDREIDKVSVKLEIDSMGEGLHYWPFVPETGNLCYCMPEIETKAMLYFPTEDEKEGIVVHILPEKKEERAKKQFQDRNFLTKFEKGIEMFPEHMKIFGGMDKLLLSDNVGIEMQSNREIVVKADKGILLKGEKIHIQAPQEILCYTENASIDICHNFNIYAPMGVTTEGTDQDSKNANISPDNREENIDSWKASFSAIAAIPTLDLARGDHDSIVDLKACGSVARFGKCSTILAMKEVMSGKKEDDTEFPHAFRSMQAYTVKGGYYITSNREE